MEHVMKLYGKIKNS